MCSECVRRSTRAERVHARRPRRSDGARGPPGPAPSRAGGGARPVGRAHEVEGIAWRAGRVGRGVGRERRGSPNSPGTVPGRRCVSLSAPRLALRGAYHEARCRVGASAWISGGLRACVRRAPSSGKLHLHGHEPGRRARGQRRHRERVRRPGRPPLPARSQTRRPLCSRRRRLLSSALCAGLSASRLRRRHRRRTRAAVARRAPQRALHALRPLRRRPVGVQRGGWPDVRLRVERERVRRL